MLEQTDEIDIPEEEIRVDVYRSSGPGGQSVNTTDSAVRLTHIPTGIVVSCQNEKSQLQNKASAMVILKAKLLALKKAEERADLDELRGDVQGSWGDQMRNYVLHPYQMVKDLRTEYETGNPQAVFDGDIDAFLEAGIRWRRGAGQAAARRLTVDVSGRLAAAPGRRLRHAPARSAPAGELGRRSGRRRRRCPLMPAGSSQASPNEAPRSGDLAARRGLLVAGHRRRRPRRRADTSGPRSTRVRQPSLGARRRGRSTVARRPRLTGSANTQARAWRPVGGGEGAVELVRHVGQPASRAAPGRRCRSGRCCSAGARRAPSLDVAPRRAGRRTASARSAGRSASRLASGSVGGRAPVWPSGRETAVGAGSRACRPASDQRPAGARGAPAPASAPGGAERRRRARVRRAAGALCTCRTRRPAEAIGTKHRRGPAIRCPSGFVA